MIHECYRHRRAILQCCFAHTLGIEGRPEFVLASVPNLIHHLATHLFRIHQVDCSKLDVSFLPQQEKRYTEKLRERPITVDESVAEGLIRETLEVVWPLPQRNTPVLLHGDFWPGNILWKDGQLVAVIDWEDAALGDPLADVANSRLEILWAFGIDLASRWEKIYQKSRESSESAARTWLYYREHPETRPFAHPYYWSAFTVSGQ